MWPYRKSGANASTQIHSFSLKASPLVTPPTAFSYVTHSVSSTSLSLLADFSLFHIGTITSITTTFLCRFDDCQSSPPQWGMFSPFLPLNPHSKPKFIQIFPRSDSLGKWNTSTRPSKISKASLIILTGNSLARGGETSKMIHGLLLTNEKL